MDVVERCGDEHVCAGCNLWDVCGGRAKEKAGRDGFVKVADVRAQRRRSSVGTFASEMLCVRPSRRDAVFPGFDVGVHVFGGEGGEATQGPRDGGAQGGEGAKPQAAGSGEARAAGSGEAQVVAGGDPGFGSQSVAQTRRGMHGEDGIAEESGVVAQDFWVGGADFGIRGDFVWLWGRVVWEKQEIGKTGKQKIGGDPGQGFAAPSLRESMTGLDRDCQDSGLRTRDCVVEIWDEYVMSDRVMREHLAAIGGRGWPGLRWVGVDPAGRARNDQTGVSNVGVLKDAGYRVRAKRSSVSAGLELIRARLRPADGSGPRLRIHRRCVRLIESMRCYHFDPKRPYDERPVKDGYDHAVDALRYLLVNLESGGGVVRMVGY